MSFTVEQKSQLAKLMATENVTVEHRKMKTAKFDPKNRVLYCPIWKDMSGSLYDLLLGHEVGHARYTPPEGWHDVVTDTEKGRAYRSFINVVEDARIEKKIQRKFPGLKLSFKNGYADLMNRDFFGTKNRDINSFCFVDRLNLFSKSQWTLPINFNEEEFKLVEQVQNAETWEDVVRVTDAIFAYSKDEQFELSQNDFEYSNFGDDGEDEYDDYESSDNESQEKNDKGDKNGSENDGDSAGENEEEREGNGNEQSNETQNEANQNEQNNSLNRNKNSGESIEDQFIPKCETDENFRRNESLLLDDQCKEYQYLEFPKPILKNIVTPAKRVHEQLIDFYNREIAESRFSNDEVRKWVNEFKTKNERYIGLLAKEFEMRKAANCYSKSKISDTGDIDVGKLASYRFDDNIFRKITITPKGKNHGLVLLLDKSGSMSENMAGSIEQILVLTMFCRKVNIPFVVYGFGNSYEAHASDLGFDFRNHENRKIYKEMKTDSFEKCPNTVAFNNVRLREYLNSRMSNTEFNNAIRNMIILKKAFEEGGSYYARVRRPVCEELSNTPLTEAIYATAPLMVNFKKSNRLDVTSLVIVHDGDADWTNDYWIEDSYFDEYGDPKTKIRDRMINSYDNNVFIRDSKTKWQKRYSSKMDGGMLHIVLDWFKRETGSKVFGFFLVPPRTRVVKDAIFNHYVKKGEKTLPQMYMEDRHSFKVNWKEKQNALYKEMKDEKFLISDIGEYNSFYLVMGGDELKTENEDIQIDGKFTASKLKNAFVKMNKKKALNRILVSKFIQGIAS